MGRSRRFLALFPDLEFTDRGSLVAADGWSVRWTMSGTLALPYPDGDRTIEPGGKMAIDAIDFITVRDGELTAKHTYLDWAAATEQLAG